MTQAILSPKYFAGILGPALIFCGCILFGIGTPDDSGHAELRPFIDLDGDGTTDFSLERSRPIGHETLTMQNVRIVPKRKNRILKKGSFLAVLGKGDLVGKTQTDPLTWTSEASFLYRVSYHTPPDSSYVDWKGFWPNADAGYLGLMLSKSGRTYYGWAHVHIDTTKPFGAVRVHKSSYNTHPGQPIPAGHKP